MIKKIMEHVVAPIMLLAFEEYIQRMMDLAEKEWTEAGMGEFKMEMVVDRVTDHVNSKVNIPYLDEGSEDKYIIRPAVRMAAQLAFDRWAPPESS